MKLKRQRHDTEGTWNIAFWLALVVFCIVSALNVKMANAQSVTWYSTPQVLIDDTNSPIPASEWHDAVEYALWQWNERLGLDMALNGTTTGTAGHGQVVFKLATLSQMAAISSTIAKGATQWAVYVDSGYMAYATVYINTGYVSGLTGSLRTTITHELGHAIGITTHSANSHDVMHAYTLGSYHLTSGDIAMSAYPTKNYCFASIGHDSSIYIPDIQGQAATLGYNGNETWTLTDLRSNPNTQGCTQAAVDTELKLTIDDLRGMGVSYTNVRMVFIGNDTWELEYAE